MELLCWPYSSERAPWKAAAHKTAIKSRVVHEVSKDSQSLVHSEPCMQANSEDKPQFPILFLSNQMSKQKCVFCILYRNFLKREFLLLERWLSLWAFQTNPFWRRGEKSISSDISHQNFLLQRKVKICRTIRLPGYQHLKEPENINFLTLVTWLSY